MNGRGFRYYLDRLNGRRPDKSRGPYAMLHRDGCGYARARRAANVAQNVWRGVFTTPAAALQDFQALAPVGVPRFTCRCCKPAPPW